MTDKTKAQLEQENGELRAMLAELEAAPAGGPVTRPAPRLPSFGMSEGTRNDIEAAQALIRERPRLTEIVIMEPFTGRKITVTEDGAALEEGPDDLDLTTFAESPATVDRVE